MDTSFANVKIYGAAGDGISAASSGVTITGGSAALTVTGASFASTDVGKTIIVPGAGASGGILVTTIAGWTSATQVTLAANASTTLSSIAESVTYGTDDTAAINAAIRAAGAGGTVYFPAGMYLNTGLTLSNSVSLVGDSQTSSILKLDASATAALSLSANNISVTNLTIDSSYLASFTAEAQLGASGLAFQNSTIKNGNAYGLLLQDNSNVSVSYCNIIANKYIQLGFLSHSAADSNISIVSNLLDPQGANPSSPTSFCSDVYFGSAGGGSVSGLVISDNIMNYQGIGSHETDGIVLAATNTAPMSNISVERNVVTMTSGSSTSGYPFEINGTTQINIDGNVITTGGQQRAIILQAAQGGGDCQGVIANNALKCTVTSGQGISITDGNWIVDNNNIQGFPAGIIIYTDPKVTNNVGTAIFGTGTIYNLTLFNQSGSTINGNGSGTTPLTLQSDTISNQGTIEATDAGGLLIDNGTTITQTGNGIVETKGGPVALNGATISGGTVQVSNGDTFYLQGGTISGGMLTVDGIVNVTGSSTIDMVTNNGLLEANGGKLAISGAVTGSGSAFIENGGTISFGNSFNENVTFSGAGAFAISQAYIGEILGFGAGDAIDLTNLSGETGYSISGNDLTVNFGGSQTATLDIAGINAQT